MKYYFSDSLCSQTLNKATQLEDYIPAIPINKNMF